VNLCLTKVTGRERVGLVPADSDSEEVIAKMGDGECRLFKMLSIRSVPWHRMYFGICRAIGKNQDPERTEHSIDYEIRIRAGHYEKMFIEGHEIRSPARIAFDRMTGDEWSEYWAKAELAIREHFGDEYIRDPPPPC
jgi:hypothetical protein